MRREAHGVPEYGLCAMLQRERQIYRGEEAGEPRMRGGMEGEDRRGAELVKGKVLQANSLARAELVHRASAAAAA